MGKQDIGLSQHIEILSHYYEKLSHYYEILSHYYEILSHYYEILYHYYEILSHYYEILYHYYEILSHYYEILSHYYEVVSHYNDLQDLFLSITVTEMGFHTHLNALLLATQESTKSKLKVQTVNFVNGAEQFPYVTWLFLLGTVSYCS